MLGKEEGEKEGGREGGRTEYRKENVYTSVCFIIILLFLLRCHGGGSVDHSTEDEAVGGPGRTEERSGGTA